MSRAIVWPSMTGTEAAQLRRRMGSRLFISYRRRDGAQAARLLSAELRERGVDVFLDVNHAKPGHFDEALLREIEAADDFVVVLTPGCLERCREPRDWLRREIAHAIKHELNIIPVTMPGFEFPPSDDLPEDVRPLVVHNAIGFSHEFFDAMIGKIMSYLHVSRASANARRSRDRVMQASDVASKATSAAQGATRAEGPRGRASEKVPTLPRRQVFRRVLWVSAVGVATCIAAIAIVGWLTGPTIGERAGSPSSGLPGAAALRRLQTYKVDIYYNEGSMVDGAAARAIGAFLENSRATRAVVLVPTDVGFLSKTGQAHGYEVRYFPDEEREVAAGLRDLLDSAYPSLDLKLRGTSTRTPGTLSVFLFTGDEEETPLERSAPQWRGLWQHSSRNWEGNLVTGMMDLTTDQDGQIVGQFTNDTVGQDEGGTLRGQLSEDGGVIRGSWANWYGQSGRFEFRLSVDGGTFSGGYSVGEAYPGVGPANYWSGTRTWHPREAAEHRSEEVSPERTDGVPEDPLPGTRGLSTQIAKSYTVHVPELEKGEGSRILGSYEVHVYYVGDSGAGIAAATAVAAVLTERSTVSGVELMPRSSGTSLSDGQTFEREIVYYPGEQAAALRLMAILNSACPSLGFEARPDEALTPGVLAVLLLSERGRGD